MGVELVVVVVLFKYGRVTEAVGIDGITIGETCGNPLLLLVYVVVVVVG
jgi:hypothetical protein